MRKGVSLALTAAVLTVVLLATVVAVLASGTDILGTFFGSVSGQLSDNECDIQVQRVQNGQLPPSEVADPCRARYTQQEWRDIKVAYEQNKVAEVLRSGQ